MELRLYTDADLALTEELETDPTVMTELGGPLPASEIPATHARRLRTVGAGDWWFTIVPDPDGPPVGTIGIWPREIDGRSVHETGWMVLPAHQGRGIASAALQLLLDRARAEQRFEEIHAFPGVNNGASNALCAKFGFERLPGEHLGEYAGRRLTYNHWVLRLDR